MKKAFLLIVLVAALLAGCAYTVDTGEVTLKVDPSGSIEDGTYQYYFYYTEDTRLIIAYPNEVYCTYNPETGKTEYGYWSEEDTAAYTDAAVLGAAICERTKAPSTYKMNFGLLFIGVGIAMIGVIPIVFPRAYWYARHSWAYKNAEPSELAIKLSVIGGVIIVLAGILGMILGLFGYGVG